MCMKSNKKLLGIGLGFNLLIYYYQTGIPYDLLIFEEGNEVKIEGKYRKAIVDGETGDYLLL